MLLRKDDPWNSSLNLPDIRDWRVVDSEGRQVGFVESVVADSRNGAVEAIMTSANDRFTADEFDVDEHQIRLRRAVRVREEPHGRSPSPGAAFTTFRDAYRNHFRDTFSDDERRFDEFADAYAFGRKMALDAHFSGRSYERAREDVRALWTMKHPARSFKSVEPAVRFAYELVVDSSRHESAGLDREQKQILGRSARNGAEAHQAGTHMTTGKPDTESGPKAGDG